MGRIRGGVRDQGVEMGRFRNMFNSNLFVKRFSQYILFQSSFTESAFLKRTWKNTFS